MEVKSYSFIDSFESTTVPHTVGKHLEQALKLGVHVQEDNSLKTY